MIYKALTILEPWASLIACGAKKVETRSWPTKYRGTIAIHTGLSQKYYALQQEEPFASVLEQFSKVVDIGGAVEAEYEDRIELEYGKVIAIAEVVDCSEMISCTLDNVNNGHKLIKVTLKNGQEITGNELAFGDYTLGRYAWELANVRRIEPIPAKGLQRIWNWEANENELHFRG